MYVGRKDFRLVVAFLNGYERALVNLRPDLKDTGLDGFGEWLAVRLDSCVMSHWSEIIFREDTGSDKFQALESLFDEFVRRSQSASGLEAIVADFELLTTRSIRDLGDRSCWCDLLGKSVDNGGRVAGVLKRACRSEAATGRVRITANW